MILIFGGNIVGYDSFVWILIELKLLFYLNHIGSRLSKHGEIKNTFTQTAGVIGHFNLHILYVNIIFR